MKNKILISIVAVLIAAGAFVFAKSQMSVTCPDTPDCICTPEGCVEK